MNTTTISSLLPFPKLTTGNGTEEEEVLTKFLQEEDDPHSPENLAFPLYLRLWATFASALIFFVGMAGNALVPVLMWRNRQLRHSTNIFLLNLALADCLVLLVCLPTALVELHTEPNAWVLGEVLCRLVPFVEVSVVRASVFTLTVISVERYIAICKPLRASTLCTRPRALGVCLGIWPASFLAAGPVLVATEFQEPNPGTGSTHATCMTPLRDPWVTGYFLGSAVAFFLLPLVFLSSIYLFIARKLLNHRARSHKKLDNVHWKARKQVAGMLGAVVVIFFVCLLPFQVFIVWVIVSPVQNINDLGPHSYFNILFACRVLVYVNAAANPVVYNAMSAKFRHALLRLLGRKSERSAGSLRRRSTLTTTFSSSSNASGSSRSNSFRRLANLALKRSFSDASIRRSYRDGQILSSPKESPSLRRVKGGVLGKWYLRRVASGSYFSGDSSCSIFSDEGLPSSRQPSTRLRTKAEYNLLLGELQNGYLQERNRSLPELFRSSPLPAKRVSFKDNVLPLERPKPVVSPLALNPLTDRTSETTQIQPKMTETSPVKKTEKKNVGKSKTRNRFYRQLFGTSRGVNEEDPNSGADSEGDGLDSESVELKEIVGKGKRIRNLNEPQKGREEIHNEDVINREIDVKIRPTTENSKFILDGDKSGSFRKII